MIQENTQLIQKQKNSPICQIDWSKKEQLTQRKITDWNVKKKEAQASNVPAQRQRRIGGNKQKAMCNG